MDFNPLEKHFQSSELPDKEQASYPVAIREFLSGKLEEYKEKLDPTKTSESQFGLVCQIAVLQELLTKGELNKKDFGITFRFEYPDVDDSVCNSAYNAACDEVEGYLK